MGFSLVSCFCFFCFLFSWLEAESAKENARMNSRVKRAEIPKSDCFFIQFPPDVGENSMIRELRFARCESGFGMRMGCVFVALASRRLFVGLAGARG